MNFFESQDRARRNSVLLVVLLAAAAVSIVLLLYVGLHLFLRGGLSWPPDWRLLADTAAGVLAVIVAGSLYKIAALAAGGGAAVAESMGGRLLSADSASADERRLLNIVAEMALASGCPPPPVYAMPGGSVNAFAAGNKIGNAVIGVTEGAMRALSREEMQGVIAHEFSHIINGDMKFNIRLMGIIHGVMLLSLIGYFLLRGAMYSSFSSRERGGGAMAMMAAGLGLIIAGSAGAFFGSWIRAAVSRQREYLADASAVQFTRNPRGIGGALQKIAALSGMQLSKDPKAAACAHLFFAEGAALGFAHMMATHPPIDERIRRVLPDWDGSIAPAPPPDSSRSSAAALNSESSAAAGFASMHSSSSSPPLNAREESSAESSATKESSPPDLFAAIFGGGEKAEELLPSVGAADPARFAAAEKILRALPPELQDALADGYSARALAYAMLLSPDSDCRRAQLQYLRDAADRGVYALTGRLAPVVARLPRPSRLPLLMQTLPALRSLSPNQSEMFSQNMSSLIAADRKVDLFEWSLEAALSHFLWDSGDVAAESRRLSATEAMEYSLSLLAQAADSRRAAEVFACAAAGLRPRLHYDSAPFSPRRLTLAMRRLDDLPPLRKQEFLQAAADCASHDGMINADEGVLLRAYAVLLDCPLPLFCGDKGESAAGEK